MIFYQDIRIIYLKAIILLCRDHHIAAVTFHIPRALLLYMFQMINPVYINYYYDRMAYPKCALLCIYDTYMTSGWRGFILVIALQPHTFAVDVVN